MPQTTSRGWEQEATLVISNQHATPANPHAYLKKKTNERDILTKGLKCKNRRCKRTFVRFISQARYVKSEPPQKAGAEPCKGETTLSWQGRQEGRRDRLKTKMKTLQKKEREIRLEKKGPYSLQI